MPILYRYATAPGYYAKAHIKGNVVTFQLTEKAQKELLDIRLVDGSKFPLRDLMHFMRRGEAFTRGGVEFLRERSQWTHDFPDDKIAEKLMPACSVTGGYDDLHLVVWHHGASREAQLLSAAPRNKLQHPVSLSIPLPLLSLNALNHLQQMDKIPSGEVIDFLRAWYQGDSDAHWETLRQERAHQSEQMLLLADDERSLFNFAR